MRARLNSAANVYYRSIKAARQSWKREQVQSCWWCGSGDGPFDCHEICPKSAAQGKWAHPCNYLLLGGSLSQCNCHERVFATLPLASQLWVKLKRNPSDFSLEEWLKIRNRGPQEVTMEDVLDAGMNISLPALRPKNTLKF